MNITIEAIKILTRLTNAQIDYVLIRNFDCLIKNKPYTEKDIDILILRKDCIKMTQLMQAEGFKKLWICPSAGHIGFAKYIDGKFLSFHYHVGGVAGSNIPYLNAEQLLLRKQQKNQINIVSDEDKFLAILLHSVLDGNKIKQRYSCELNRLIKHNLDWEYIKSTLNSKLASHLVQKIIVYLQQNNYARIEKIIPRIQENFKYGKLSRRMQLLKSNLHKYLWFAWRLTKNAPLVSFIGMDGTGKTTMTNLLKEKLDRSLITNELIYTGRGRNNILPIQFFAKPFVSKTVNIGNQNEHKTDKQNKSEKTGIIQKILCTLSAPIFAFDLLLRYWLVILPKRKTKQIVLTDRYSTDILLMKDVPMILKRIMFAFFPRPTITIYLYNTPKTLHKRKPDHPLGDLYRQQKIFVKINRMIQPKKIKSDRIDWTSGLITEVVSNTLI